MSNWWDADKIETPGGTEFWKADEVVSETPQEEQEVVTSARGSEARADVEQEVISDRANNWRNRSIFKDKPAAGAGRGSADDPRRLDRAQESEWVKEVRGNLPTIDGNLQISAPEPKKPREYKSVLEGVRMTGGGFDEREAQKLSRRDYAEQAEREAGFADRGSQRMTEARQPILSDRQRFAEENPITAGLAQSAANTLVGTLNAPAVVAGLVNESLVQPLSRAAVGAAGGDERLLPGRVPNMPLVDDLRSIGSEYASQLSRKTPGQAWDDGDFGRWLMTQMSANSFSAAQSLGALFVPGAQATLLSSMGAVSAGNAYADGDSAKASALKGLVEAGSEMLPLKAAEKIKDLVLTIPEPMRQKALADAGKRLLAAGTAVTTNSLVGALEETVAQVGGNAIDIGISGKNKSLFDEVDRAAIVGGAFGGGMSAPAVIESATGPTSPEQRRALELARALNGGEFTPESIDSAVANTLRTEPGSSNLIDPVATSIGVPAMQVAAAERARVDDMIAKRDEIKTQVEAVKTEAIADIGRQETVDGAIAATTRAVNLDSNVLLDGALKAAGIDPNELQAVDKQAQAAINTVAEPAADAALAAAPVASTQPDAAPQPQQSTVVWTGRRGDGYATPEDASRALNERQRLRPAYDWTVQQNPEGRYVLEGAPKGQGGAQAGISAAGNAQAAPIGQNAPASLGDQLAAAGIAQPKETVRDLRDQADQVQRLQAAIARSGDDASAIELYRPGRDTQHELGVGRRGQGAGGAGLVAQAVQEVGRVSQLAFGWKPIAVTGLPNAFGVQYAGRVFIDVEQVAKGDKKNAPELIAIQTIGHETTHALEKSSDPQDQADYARLRSVILGNAKPGVVDARVAAEKRGQTYGENEVVADVSGSFWSDPDFWSRLYDLDDGSTMRRIAYKFMQNATKLLKAVKGSRFDNERFVNNIEQVREVAAQVWASKAKRGDSLFASQDQTVSKSQADRLPGVNAEVAPDPRNKEAAEKWGKLTEVDKLGITKEVMDRVATKVFDNMGLQGWSVEYTSGMFEGGVNPSAILRAPDGTSTELLGEVMRVFGYVLDQKGMVAFDESNTTSESQAGFVKVVLPEGLSTDKIDLIRKEIAARVPQAEGDTVRDGAIVYGNFSAYNDKIETLDDNQFKQAIEDAIAEIDVEGTFDVAGPFRFHSEYDQAYWDDAYDPKGREAYLEKTRYGSSDQQEALPGRDGVRRGLGGNLSRTWLDNLARDTDTRISRLVGDKQPRKAYGTTPDARADRARTEQPARPRGGDRAGRPDAVRSGVSGVVAASVGGAGKDIRGAVHYGRVGQLNSLSGAMNGTGIRGAENDRVAQAADPRIRQRVYFYLPVEGGIPQPESGLGQHVYKADLSNLYDINSQQMRLPADSNAMDSAILDAGYRGYFNEAQGTVVMFGSVPVSYQGTSDQFNKVMRRGKATKPKNVTRSEGNMLVRKPEGQEVMEVIRAKQAGINEAAPSFEMAYGEARVLASEVQAADAVFESLGGTFRFGEAAYSRADADVTETANFKRWFGDSKVVDAQGKPLVVYHGTGADFSEFSVSKIGSAWGADTVGFFFTDSAKTASSYATSGGPTLQRDDGANIIPAYIRISRPVTVEALEAFTGESGLADAYESPIELMDERRDDIMSMLLGNEQDDWSIDKDSKPSVNNTHDGVIFSFGGSTLVVAVDPAQIKSAIGNNGNFDPADPRISYSKDDFNELGAFNLDISDDLENESLSFLDDKKTMKAIIQEELEAERRMAEKVRAAAVAAAPTQGEIEKAGYAPEKAFNLTGALVYDEAARKYEYAIPTFAKGIIRAVRARGANKETPDVTVEQSMHTTFVTKAPSPEIAERFINRQVAGAYLQSTGFDLADTYRKGTIQKIASTWKAISKHSGFFKLPARSGNLDFESVAKEMGAMRGYDITTEDLGYLTIVTMRKDGKAPFKAEYSFHGREIECCTMGLEGSGGLGTEFYAVLSQIAENAGKRFVPDAVLSGVNTYRRTEQAMSYALKSGRTDVLLPGPLTRVYGYNESPTTQQDHDTNIARLAIAGMRNAEELFPDVRRLSYDPAADSFTDSRGQDAEAQVKAALADPEARAMGLGRSTLARAVLTSDIISGKLTAADVTEFEKPVAYSMADVGMDEPMAESWGDDRDGVNSLTPQLRRFIAGSKIVNNEGLPIVMYHGTGRDIQAFRAKQAGAIFVTYNPKFADDFAALSVDWMRANWREVLTPEQIEAAKKQAAAAIMADKSIKMSERKAMKQSIMDGTPTGAAEDAMAEAAANAMPSGENIIPVFVRATAPFDFRVPSMVQDVIYTLQDRQGVESGGEVEIQLVKEGGQRMKVSEDDLEMALRSGMWEFIESPEIQAVIRDDLAHDGFFVKETGQVNLAVYEPSQLKSVFNRGTYDLGDDRLSYSRAALDDYMVRRNKTMPAVSGASAQEADIALAVKAIDAVSAEIERGNKAILPIPLGRTPHVLGMFRAPNKMLRIDTSILRKVLFDKHSEDFADVSAERFVRAIYQPAMVLRGRSAGEFEIVTDIVTKRGPILIPVMTGGDGPSAAVMSAYAKNVNGAGESLMKRINSGALLYADPVLAQIAVTGQDSERIRGIITSGAQFPSAPPRRAQSNNVNQADSSVKPLNPNFVGWDRVRDAIIGGIRERKVKSDVDLMRRIGDLYRGDWSDAPSFSRADIEDSANFKRWFGDSKVVDAEGKPLVVYHATTSDIKKFSIKKSTGGFYFTPEARDAYPSQRGSMTSERGLNVMPCYLSIVNPLRTSNPAEWHRLDSKRRSEIEARGFDGVVVENADGSVREFIAFRPEQIKSAIGNNGNFDPADPDIRFSRADIEDSANFKRWFGDSKVVDAEGKPLVVYHGTGGDFNQWGFSRWIWASETPDLASQYAEFRGEQGGNSNVMPLYMKAEAPFNGDALPRSVKVTDFINEVAKQAEAVGKIIEKTAVDNIIRDLQSAARREGSGPTYSGYDFWQSADALFGTRGASEIRNFIVRAGFDSITYTENGNKTWGVVENTQIKSAFNNGNFDPADPRISYSQAAGYDIPEESFAYKARRKMQDYFIRARLVQEAIASQGGVVDETTDFYRAEELSHGRIGSLLQDFADQQVRPLMEKAVEFGIELDELSLYAYAMHAKERNAYIASIDPKMQDGGSGMTNDEADSILDLVKLSGDQAKFDELHSDLMAITRGNRLAMLADGLITQDEFDKLEGAYDHYIPLRGFELMDEDGKPTGRSPGKGFNIRGPETLKAKGRRSRAGQLVENVISDYQRTVVRGERNHVAKVFLNFVLSNPDDALWEIDATTTRKSLDRQTGRIARNTVIEKGEDTISVKIQGREIYIKIKDDLLLRAMRKTYTDETGEMANDLMRSVGLYSSLLRNTLTRYNPEFAVVNAMRDFGFGATAALDALGEKGAAKFVAHYAGAMAVSARNESKKLDASREWDKWFLEYKATGGTTSGFYTKGLEEIGNDIRDMMIEAGAQPKDFTEKMRFNRATRAAKAALRVLEYAGSVSENAARVAAYRTAREMGKTPSQAASIAKNLTTNFDRKGEYGQILNALYLFYNAGIQGTQKTLQMFRNPKILGYMAGVTAASVALALASATAGGDDPDDGMAYWDKIPAHVKERNIIIMLPPGVQVEGAEEVGTKGRYLTIPVQYGLNIFHVFGYQIADVIRNQQDKTRGVGFAKGGINMASAVAGSFNPFGGAVDLTNESSRIQAILPTVFDFPYQLVSGTNAFGRDVAPFKSPFDSKPDSQNSNVRQAGAPSEKVAQWLNSVTGGSAYEPGAIDISAGTVENLVRNLTGGTGMFVYDVLALTGKSVDTYTGGDPDLFVRDIPVVRRVLGETAGDVDQGLFYERRKAIQEARAIQKGAEEADAEITNPETLALASMNKDASKYTRWLSEIRKEMAEVKRDPDMSNVERQTRIRELRAQRDSLTAEFNRNFMEVMREEFNSSAAR